PYIYYFIVVCNILRYVHVLFFFCLATARTEIYTLSLHDALPILSVNRRMYGPGGGYGFFSGKDAARAFVTGCFKEDLTHDIRGLDRKSTRLNSSHLGISYAVFCLKKKNKKETS